MFCQVVSKNRKLVWLVPLIGAINAFLTYNCTKMSPPHFSGSYMSYDSLVDVRKTWERTATLNGRVHKV